MKNLRQISLIGMVLFLLVGACENLPKVEPSDSSNLKSETTVKPAYTFYKLYAGQNLLFGMIKVWIEGDYLNIEYYIWQEPCWCFKETHLHVATSLGDIPQTKKGNPIPGKFDYKGEYDDCKSKVNYQIDMKANKWDVNTQLYIAAHAVVKCGSREETAWGSCCSDCIPFNPAEKGKNWATYFMYPYVAPQ